MPYSRTRGRAKWTRNRRYRQLGSFSGGVITYQGDVDLVKLLSSLEDKTELMRDVKEVLLESKEPVEKYMRDFMNSHLKGQPRPATQSTEPRGTGQTNQYLTHKFEQNGDEIILRIGFKKRDYESGSDKRAPEGLSALFLDIGTRDAMGTPLITPTFFIYYAVANNLDEVRRIQNFAMRARIALRTGGQ